MLKIEFITTIYIDITFEFKRGDSENYGLIVIQSETYAGKSAVWHSNYIPEQDVNELIALLKIIKDNRYSAGTRTICDGTWVKCETDAFKFEFEFSEEGENALNLAKKLQITCNDNIADKSFGEREQLLKDLLLRQ